MVKDQAAGHTVEKIGGTSMARFDEVLEHVILEGHPPQEVRYGRVFVVSAYAGVTDALLEHKKTGAPGIYARFVRGDGWPQALAELRERMLAINARHEALGLNQEAARAFVDERLEGIRVVLRDVERICSYGHFQLADHLPTVREMLSALGEAHAAWSSVEILRSLGVNARLVDLSGWMDTDTLPLDEAIERAFRDVDPARELPIVTGYTKCSEGLMGTFDRGYTEITFSRVAVLTGAREGVIHKEFHLSSGDPKVVGVDKVEPIGRTNFDVADQLADLGMEAIHPKASKGMERAGIDIRVKNAFEPAHPGTLITRDYRSERPRVEIIAGRADTVGVELWDPDMVGQVGYDYRLLGLFADQNISYIAKNTNANTITHYVSQDEGGLPALLDSLRETYPHATLTVKPVGMVSAIGSNMDVPGFLSQAAEALARAHINILALDQCMRQVNMQFIVDRADFHGAIRALHAGLVEQPIG